MSPEQRPPEHEPRQTGPHQPESQARQEDPRLATDPTAWRAIAVAALLGIPATVVMGMLALFAGARYSLCSPDYTCGGLPGNDVYAAWFIGGFGFAGPAFATLVLDRVGQRRRRWICAGTSVAVPVLTLVVAALLCQPSR